MGAEQSKEAGGGQTSSFGFNVLRVDPQSPASNAKLQPHFDYIVAVNGVEIIQEEPNAVAEMAKNHVDREMKMIIYNSRLDETREVTIVPSKAWGGKTLLGASIRFCRVTDAADRVWHIQDVIPNSPAHQAVLIPQKDWIIGSPEIALNSVDDFYQLMIHNQKRPVRLLVFNIDQEAVREAVVIPSFEWGGEGCLGCDVASGALHRIPKPREIIQNDTIVPPPPSPSVPLYQEAPLAPPPPQNIAPSSRPNLQPIPGFDTAQDDENTNNLFSLQ